MYQFRYTVIQLFVLYYPPISLHKLQCSSAHTVSCLCMFCLFPVLYMLIWRVPLCHQTAYSLHLISVSVCTISAARYSVQNVWSCAATISLPVSTFRFPLDSHSKLSINPSNIPTRKYFVSYVSLRACLILGLSVECLALSFHCYQFIPLTFQQILMQS